MAADIHVRFQCPSCGGIEVRLAPKPTGAVMVFCDRCETEIGTLDEVREGLKRQADRLRKEADGGRPEQLANEDEG